MIEQANLDQGQRFAQASGHADVGGAGLGDAAGVVVRDDDGRRSVMDGAPYHFARVDAGTIDRAVEQFLEGDDAMARVEESSGEDFLRSVTQVQGEVVGGMAGIADRLRSCQGTGQVTLRQRDDGAQFGALGRADAAHAFERPGVMREQTGETVGFAQNARREGEHVLAAHPGAQEQGQQFGVTQGARAKPQQALAGSVFGGKVGETHDRSFLRGAAVSRAAPTRASARDADSDTIDRKSASENSVAASLEGLRCLLGVSGGIAAYKSADLVRRLRDAGAEVQVVLTENAARFVTAQTFQAVSGRPVRMSLWDESAEAAMGHIELARWAEVILVAPASADLIARLAQGRADDLLSTLCLASEAPLVIAPAMNRVMWSKAATQDNVAQLRARGVRVLGPASGDQACGETGAGRMLEPLQLVAALAELQSATRVLMGRKVLVNAGPTFEDIDPVRFIGNRSSGRMGFAIAEAAAMAGADVTLVAGPVDLATPRGVHRVDVRSARDMHVAVLAALPADAFVATAAVADYRIAAPATQKIKRSAEALTLQLVPNPDIVADIARHAQRPTLVVAFAAETENVVENARGKLARKRVDLVCANRVGADCGFERTDNALDVVAADGEWHWPQAPKTELARRLVELIAQRLGASP